MIKNVKAFLPGRKNSLHKLILGQIFLISVQFSKAKTLSSATTSANEQNFSSHLQAWPTTTEKVNQEMKFGLINMELHHNK